MNTTADSNLQTIYLLRLDKDHIKQVQEATLTTKHWGIEQTHGLFGSPEWSQHIEDGTLPTYTRRGVITALRMESMNDWPVFDMRAEDGKEYTWSQHANGAELGNAYRVGRNIEVDFVMQRSRYRIPRENPDQPTVIAVRIE